MARYRLVLPAITLVALSLAACQQPAPDNSKVVATVNGAPITEKELADHFARSTGGGKLPETGEQRKEVLNELVDRVLLMQAAEKAGIDKNPEIQIRLRRIKENAYIEELLRISKEDVEKRFREEAEKTHKTEYRVRHILVKDEAEAKAIIEQLKKGASFAKLAKEKSIDTGSAPNGGELPGWINQGMVVPEFFEGVMKTRKGSYTEIPVKSSFGWHIIKVEDARPFKVPTLEQFMADRQAIERLVMKMRYEKAEAMLKDLRAKAKIETK
jgi:peptidyl-prolyl cis-trans isomerase C